MMIKIPINEHRRATIKMMMKDPVLIQAFVNCELDENFIFVPKTNFLDQNALEKLLQEGNVLVE